MATNDEIMRAGRRARLARSNARALARECKACHEYEDKLGTHYVGTRLAGLAFGAWVLEGWSIEAAVEMATVTDICFHTETK